MKNVIIWILLLSTTLFVQAQDTILLEGTVLNDTIDRSDLNVVNVTLQKGTVTNKSGVFKIPVRMGDSIHISAVQYNSKQFVVTKTIYDRKQITLYLEPKVTELQEVEISNRKLTGNIKKDMNTIKLKKHISPSDLGIPENKRAPMTVEERRLYGATGGAGAVGAIINAISGRTKMLKKHVAVSRLEHIVNHNRAQFSDSLYVEKLNIPKALIDDFGYYMFEDREAIELVDTDNLMELLAFMMKKSSVYLDLKEAEKSSPIPKIKQQ